MPSKLEAIYARLPVFLQNVAVSVKGWTLTRNRFGGKYNQYVSDLMRSQWFSREQFRQMQICELRRLLREAVENVPYYRQALDKFTDGIDTINLENLKKIPFLYKYLLREDTDRFINKSRLKYGHEQGHTSGTSGAPVVWPYDFDSLQYDLAFRERQYRWAGITGREKSARFGGRVLLGNHNSPPYWRYNMAEKQCLFSSYHISEETLPIYYEALLEFNSAYVHGYPSAIYEVAKWINKNGKSGLWRPWAITVSAETLMDFQRQEIEKAFASRVFNYYSSSDGAPFITQCCAQRMHLNPESGIIEFLRPDGTEAQPGEEAEMVVTSFFQRSMPLIRFKIGDTAMLSEVQTCPCGRQMPIVEYIGGRESDVLYTSQS
ncbi:MAG: hypothetical protein A2173_12010, partial [Planctomycetes bacterium RBG_13_44_8b]